jgi:hypothetical protein
LSKGILSIAMKHLLVQKLNLKKIGIKNLKKKKKKHATIQDF